MTTEETTLVSTIAEQVRVLRGVIQTAVDKSPAEAVSMVADYMDECGCEGELAELVDAWRKKSAAPPPSDR